jgi:asparagine synthase (glutamine-hydrolysing)
VCGIGGAFGLGVPLTDAVIDAVRALPASLRHRGPDAAGYWVAPDRSAAFAATRLAVRDLRPEGNQPFETSLGTTVYNGELYRWPSTRVLTRGQALRTSGDTEIIHQIMCGDQQLFSQIAGMFASATWRADTGSLWIARDRMGEKPLYLVQTDKWLAFGSELKALASVGLLEKDLDTEALSLFLRLGYVPEPWTIYRGAHPLPPGSLLEVARTGEQLMHSRIPVGGTRRPGESEATDLRRIIVGAVNDAMIADVPTGIFLSGGIDSSAIAAAAVASGHRPLAMTLAAPSWADEEATYAARTAEHIGLPHRTASIDPVEAYGCLDPFFRAMDQPTVDGFNSFLIAKAGRESGLTVALSGVGGDELFRGYSTFSDMSRLRRLRGIPGAGAAANIYGRFGRRPLVAERLEDALRSRSTLSLYLARRGILGSRTAEGLLAAEVNWDSMLATMPKEPPAVASDNDDRETSWLETTYYLRSQLLRDIDVFSMANSLEVRAPLLLPDVVDFGLGLSNDHRFRRKTLLRAAFSDDLPAETVSRPKRGFGLPWESWLRGSFTKRVDSALFDSRFSAEYLRRPATERLHAAFVNRRAHWSTIWALTVLCIWYENQSTAAVAGRLNQGLPG